ncbi:hypothetical protein [Stenotrophomonas sp. AB1(2024)]|uniref:hypothetical protein n=1 Tax=Stenotrophomonas sp. AB1(2024) TaxID=3132215 RepID=UPI0030999175
MTAVLFAGKASLGLLDVNKTGQIIPKVSTVIGRLSVWYTLLEPVEMGCAELDCDKNGIINLLEKAPATCYPPSTTQ